MPALPVPHIFLQSFTAPPRYRVRHGGSDSGGAQPAGRSCPSSRRARQRRFSRRHEPGAGRVTLRQQTKLRTNAPKAQDQRHASEEGRRVRGVSPAKIPPWTGTGERWVANPRRTRPGSAGIRSVGGGARVPTHTRVMGSGARRAVGLRNRPGGSTEWEFELDTASETHLRESREEESKQTAQTGRPGIPGEDGPCRYRPRARAHTSAGSTH